MKITDRCPNANTFGELKTGDIFRDGTGDTLMKIRPFSCEDLTNCISLIDGDGYGFNTYDRVIPITNVELIIG